MNHRYVCCLPEAWLEALEALAARSQADDPVPDPEPVAELVGDTLRLRIEGIILPTRYGAIRCTPCDELYSALGEHAGQYARVELLVDSPGGVAQGVDTVHATLLRLRADGVPVVARVSGLCASAAYWLASAADEIAVRPTSEVGGIGVYRVYYDRSEALRDAGVRPVVVRSGPHKAVGVDAITSEQEAVELQNIMDIHAEFCAAVARGRGMAPEDVAVLATGRTWVGRRAVSVGLADRLDEATDAQEVDDMSDDLLIEAAAADAAAVDEVAEDAAAGSAGPAVVANDEDPAAPTVDPVTEERARVAALLSAFADDPAFAARCVTDGLTLTEAKALWFDERRATRPAAGPEPVAPVAAVPPDVDAREAVRRMAAEQGIPLSRAWARYWRENKIFD